MTCKDCVHYEVCKEQDAMLGENKIDEIVGVENHCEFFKPKSRFVELPCEVGQKVYVVFDGKVYKKEVISITMLFASCVKSMSIHCQNSRGAATTCGTIDFGKTVFLSREDAEKALAERSK